METKQKEVLLLFGSNYNHAIHRGVAEFAANHRWHLTVVPYQIHHPPRNWNGAGTLAMLGLEISSIVLEPLVSGRIVPNASRSAMSFTGWPNAW